MSRHRPGWPGPSVLTTSSTANDQSTASFAAAFAEPGAPSWGQREVHRHPEIHERITRDEVASHRVAVVLGAGGAFAPDLLYSLREQGVRDLFGTDIQLSFKVPGITYHRLDLTDPNAVRHYAGALMQFAVWRDLAIYDLAAIQTDPSDERRHDKRRLLSEGKRALLEALAAHHGDVYFAYMSSGEVFGVPTGGPLREDHAKTPINLYGRHKLEEEQMILGFNGRPTSGAAIGSKDARGSLHVTALRPWTMSMVNYDREGKRIVSTRNYNDPMIWALLDLHRVGVRLRLGDIPCQFHKGTEVAEVMVKMAASGPDAKVWGKAFNCPGRPAPQCQLADIAYRALDQARPPLSTVRRAVGRLLSSRVALEAIAVVARTLKLRGYQRLAFLERDITMNSDALLHLLGDRLHDPLGGLTKDAALELVQGLVNDNCGQSVRARYQRY